MPYLHIPRLGQVHYHKYGSGNRLMFAFHGYGMTGRQFQVLERSILQQYRVIGFDHFFHGHSELAQKDEKHILSGMQREDVTAYVEAWFAQNPEERFSLMAYSIGANFALLLTEYYADKIDSLYLMAPDGLIPHKGFAFLRQNFIGKRLFRRLTYSASLATSGLNTLKRFGMLDAALHRIAYNEMDTPEKRLDVYYTLNFIRKLQPDVARIAALINRYQIQTTLIFGKHDALFPIKNGRSFMRLLEKKRVLEVALGHWLVTPELDEILAVYDKS